MAPVKMPKKPLKVMEKPLEKPIAKTKKMKKKNYQSFSIFLFKLLRSITEEKVGITKSSMMIMNNFVHDFMEMIAVEAGRLIAHGDRSTLGSREIQTAVKLLVPGELAKHACSDGIKALTLYHNNTTKS